MRDLPAAELVGMVRGFAMAHPEARDLLDEVARRLSGNAERSRQYRETKKLQALSERSEGVQSAQRALTERSEGGVGGDGVLIQEPSVALVSGEEGKDSQNSARLTLTHTNAASAHRALGVQNAHGETPGWIAFRSVYPECRRDYSLARWWLTEGLEAECEAIMAGTQRWIVYWALLGDESKIPAMRKYLERKDYKGNPPKIAAASAPPGQRPETTWAPAPAKPRMRSLHHG